jgi:hypothetical protein
MPARVGRAVILTWLVGEPAAWSLTRGDGPARPLRSRSGVGALGGQRHVCDMGAAALPGRGCTGTPIWLAVSAASSNLPMSFGKRCCECHLR